MENKSYFNIAEQCNLALKQLLLGNIENYPDIILMICRKLCKIYLQEIKEFLGLKCDDLEVFEKIRNIDTGKEYGIRLEIFAEFAYELLNEKEQNNPILDKFGLEWLKNGYEDMLNIVSFIDEFKGK